MTQITLDAAIAAAQELAEANSDFVYPAEDGCRYADPTTEAPSCIVGHILQKLDPELFAQVVVFEKETDSSFPVYAFGDTESEYEDRGDETVEMVLYDYPEKHWDEDTKEFFGVIQRLQDGGSTWGTAVAVGIKTVATQAVID